MLGLSSKRPFKKKIKEPLTKFQRDKGIKELIEEADRIDSLLNDPWWLTAAGFIPIVGDGIDLAKSAYQAKQVFNRLDSLHGKIQTYLKKRKKVEPHVLSNAISDYRTQSFRISAGEFVVTKERMKHILERHHPKYWNGSFGKDTRGQYAQSFFDEKMTIQDIEKAILCVLKSNENYLAKTNGRLNPISAVCNGTKYVLGFEQGLSGKMGQFYSEYL